MFAVAVFSSAQADIINVDIVNCPGPGSGTVGDPYCSIQTAVDNAVDADEILVASGTYFETINFLGKAITLRGVDGRASTIIDGQQNGTVVLCESGEGPDTVLTGFTITGGDASGPFPANTGGGMRNADGSCPTVTDCSFIANTASFGGGIFSYCATVTNCLFVGNTATQGGGFEGGGTVADCTFNSNSGTFGGGMRITVGGSALNWTTVDNCTFTLNTVIGYGGGMAVITAGIVKVNNCVFIDNEADGHGGAVGNVVGALDIINCTFSGNSAPLGATISCSVAAQPLVGNCIMWDLGEIWVDPNGLPSEATVYTSNIEIPFPGLGNISVDPMFVSPATGDLRLAPDSPCIDAGGNILVPSYVKTDFDGNPRFVDVPEVPDTGVGDPPLVDMGAFESLVACPADLDGDGTVGIDDFLIVLGSWGGPDGDTNGDGTTDILDFLNVLGSWGPCP